MAQAILDSNVSNNDKRILKYANIHQNLLFGLTVFVLLGCLVANQTHIETDDHEKLFGGLELMARLGFTGLAGLLGAFGFIFYPRVRTAFYTFPGAWILGIGVCYVTGTICSPYFSYAFPHLITFVAILLFSPFAFHLLGTKKFIYLTLGSMMISLVASWFLYLAMPAYGVMIEITDQSGDSVERMGGTSHPNVLAGNAVLMQMLLFYCLVERKLKAWICIPLLLFCFATLISTGTRVAALAGFVSIALVYRDFWFRKDVIPFSAALATILLLGALIIFSNESKGLFSSSLLKSTTRSGDMEEITSVTGRAEIWEYVIQRIKDRPIRGYGPGVAKIYLDKKQYLLHTHNVILNMGFLGGIICGMCAIMMFLQQLLVSLGGKYRLAALISFVVILNSLTENPIFDYIPGTTTVLWLAAVFWPTLDDGSL